MATPAFNAAVVSAKEISSPRSASEPGRGIIAAEYFQQRRLTGTVFAHQRMHLAAIAIEANIGQRFYAGERFAIP
jgi:hypothetical protein